MTASNGDRPAQPAGSGPVAEATIPERDRELVPFAWRVAAAYAWRFVAIALALVPIGWIIAKASILVIPLLVAALLAALLSPLMNRLLLWRVPRPLALAITLLVLIAGVTGLIMLVVSQFRRGIQIDWAQLQQRYQQLLVLLRDSPLHLSEAQLNQAFNQFLAWAQGNVSNLAQQALSAGSTVLAFFTGSLVTLFALVFYLLDGAVIWRFLVSLFPPRARAAVDGAGRRGWVSVGHYARVQILVALIDAVGIGVGALVLGVPFVLPLSIIVFLASFVPFLGAILSGALVVLVALLYNGPVNAVFMLLIVLAVMQIESHVLQPFIMGSAVKVHPLGVLLAVSAGSIFGGIPGAVFAVPIVASLKSMVEYIESGQWRGQPDPTGRAPTTHASQRMSLLRRRILKQRIMKERPRT
ncbi:MAG: AI-2E family transporter [Pseudoclavibacter sp.]|nr:AI-2E family transporter [Pseudoclavibacter sp.]